MREKEFMEMAKQEILRQLPEDVRAGLSLKEVKVVKINDQKNHGFCFQKDGSKASPTLYLDQAYDLFRHGASLERLMGDVTRAYLESIGRGIDPAEPDLSFDNIIEKSQFLQSLCEQIIAGHRFAKGQQSIIDRCTENVYRYRAICSPSQRTPPLFLGNHSLS